jgi:hypothetical protein
MGKHHRIYYDLLAISFKQQAVFIAAGDSSDGMLPS